MIFGATPIEKAARGRFRDSLENLNSAEFANSLEKQILEELQIWRLEDNVFEEILNSLEKEVLNEIRSIPNFGGLPIPLRGKFWRNFKSVALRTMFWKSSQIPLRRSS